MQIGVQDLDAGRGRHVAGRDLAGPLRLEVHVHGLVGLRADHEALQVQDDVGDVLGHLRDRRELVQHTLDPDRGDRGSGDRRQQRAAQGVPDRVAEPRLERLDRELRSGRGHDVLGDLRPGDDEQLHSLLRRGIIHSCPAFRCVPRPMGRRGAATPARGRSGRLA